MQFKNKSEVLNKIVELAAILYVNGELTEDDQSQFISNMIMTILTASQDANHAKLLNKNVINFINEVYVIDGKKSIGEFAKEQICLN
jgi:hypothetical protein